MPDMRSFADAAARHGKQIAEDAAKSAVQSALSGNGSDSSSGDAAAGGAGDMAAAAVSGFIGKKKSGAISAASMEDSQGRFDELTEGLGTSLDAVDAAGIGAAKRGSAFGSREGGNAAKGARKPDMRKSFGTAKDSRALAKKALHGTRGAMQEGGVESAAVGSMFTAIEEAGADSAAGAAAHASTRLAAMGPGAAGRRAKGGPGAGRALRNAAFDYFDGMTDDGISDVTSDIKTAYAGYRTTVEGAKLARAGVRTAGKGARAVGRAAASAPGSAVKLGRAVVGAPDRVAASARAAKEKSMAIAKAVREGRIITGMGATNQLKAMDVARRAVCAIGDAALRLVGWLAGAVSGLIGPLCATIAPVLIGIMILTSLASAVGSVFFGGGAPQQMNEVESQVYEFFKGKELGDIQIAAIMGNMKAESGMNPALVEHKKVINDRINWSDEQLLSYPGTKEDGCGIGLCQWSYDRRKKLIQFAQSQGKDWRTDVGLQMEFFWDHDEWQGEWSDRYGNGWTKTRFLNTKDLGEATRCFAYGWERYSGNSKSMDERIANANEYLEMIQGVDATGVVAEARKQVGKPYVWGAVGPDSFDCSGLVCWCYRQAMGIDLASTHRTAQAQCNLVTSRSPLTKDMSKLRPGDLLFWGTDGSRAKVTHVAIYAGGGKVIEAANPSVGVVERDYSWRCTGPNYIGGGSLPAASEQ